MYCPCDHVSDYPICMCSMQNTPNNPRFVYKEQFNKILQWLLQMKAHSRPLSVLNEIFFVRNMLAFLIECLHSFTNNLNLNLYVGVRPLYVRSEPIQSNHIEQLCGALSFPIVQISCGYARWAKQLNDIIVMYIVAKYFNDITVMCIVLYEFNADSYTVICFILGTHRSCFFLLH